MTEKPELSEFQRAVAAGGIGALEALRDSCAATLEATNSARDRGPLYRRLQELLAEIDRLQPRVSGDAIDQLQQRRRNRRRGAGS
jgi:hypothetical protein